MKMNKFYLFFLLVPTIGFAQGERGYQRPPQEIVDLVEAPTTPSVTFTSDGSLALLFTRPDYPEITDVSQPVLGLAGLRLNPANNSSAVARYSTGIRVKDLKSGSDKAISGLPPVARIGQTSLNPDESMLAFTHSGDNGVELWVADLETLQARKLTERQVNAAYGTTFRWAPDGRRLLVSLIPEGRGVAPQADPVPA